MQSKKLFIIFSLLCMKELLPVELAGDCDSLLHSAQEGCLDDVLTLLQSGVTVDCVSKAGNTPLNIACAGGYLPVVKALLAYKADVNFGNSIGVTPLYRAASKGHVEIVKELLKNEDINVNASDDQGATALFCASFGGHLGVVKELLKRQDINVNSLLYLVGASPLDVALTEEIKEALIQKGAIKFTPIIKKMDQFVSGVNKGDYEKLDSVISENNHTLRSKIRSIVKDGFVYDFNASPIYDNAKIINVDKVKIIGIFSARGRTGFKLAGFTWELGGISNYFVLEKKNNEWFITDTDFAEKLGGSYFWIFLACLISGIIFWIWMLIDCFNRNFDKRGRWFVFLLIFNIIAALVYFFTIKMRHIRSH